MRAALAAALASLEAEMVAEREARRAEHADAQEMQTELQEMQTELEAAKAHAQQQHDQLMAMHQAAASLGRRHGNSALDSALAEAHVAEAQAALALRQQLASFATTGTLLHVAATSCRGTSSSLPG